MPKPSPQSALQLLLPEPQIEKLLAIGMARGADFAEVYAERTERTMASLEDGKIKSASFGVDQGVGIRVVSGAKVGYSYSDDLDDDALAKAADTAAHIAATQKDVAPINLRPVAAPRHYQVNEALSSQAVDKKVALLLRGDLAAQAGGTR